MAWNFAGNVAGGLISGVGSLIGGNQSKKNAEKAAMMNYLMQKEFAQNGVRWKVEDAKRAGIHPLFALGASTQGFSPVSSYAGDNGISQALDSMGQGVSRAVQAKQTREERILEQARQQKKNMLDIKQLEANIKATEANAVSEMAQASYYSRMAQQKIPTMPSSVTDNKNGQGDYSAGSWKKLGNGDWVYFPDDTVADLASENKAVLTQFVLSALDGINRGIIEPPQKLKPNQEFYLTEYGGLNIRDKKNRGKPWHTMDLYEIIDYVGNKFGNAF